MQKSMLLGLLLLAGCGVRSQPTPEPGDTERINALVEELGTQRTYNSQTLLPNPDPDGLVLMRWLDRRKATLDGTLPGYKPPASSNPGSISATLAWERDAEQSEIGGQEKCVQDMLDEARNSVSGFIPGRC